MLAASDFGVLFGVERASCAQQSVAMGERDIPYTLLQSSLLVRRRYVRLAGGTFRGFERRLARRRIANSDRLYLRINTFLIDTPRIRLAIGAWLCDQAPAAWIAITCIDTLRIR